MSRAETIAAPTAAPAPSYAMSGVALAESAYLELTAITPLGVAGLRYNSLI